MEMINKFRNTEKNKPVISIKDNIEREYISLNEASRVLKIDCGSIGHCLKGKRKTAGGFKWKYK
jgi:hypothetical protein